MKAAPIFYGETGTNSGTNRDSMSGTNHGQESENFNQISGRGDRI